MRRLLFLPLLLALVLPVNAWMAMQVSGGGVPAAGGAALSVNDTDTTHDQDATAAEWNFTHTTNSGTNLLLVCCAISAQGSPASKKDLNSITFNEDSLVEIFDVIYTGDSQAVACFYRQNPDIVTDGAVVVTYGDVQDGACFARGYTGANAASPIADSDTQETSVGTSFSHTLSCASGNELVLIAETFNRQWTITSGTEIYQGDDGSGAQLGAYIAGEGASTTISYDIVSSTSQVLSGVVCVAD